MLVQRVGALRDARPPRCRVAELRCACDAGAVAGRAGCLNTSSPPRSAAARGSRLRGRQRGVVLARDRDFRDRLDASLIARRISWLAWTSATCVSVATTRARHVQDDRDADQDAQNEHESVEEFLIVGDGQRRLRGSRKGRQTGRASIGAKLLNHRPRNYAPVAQLDRVSASEAEGREFESRRARHCHDSRSEQTLVGRTIAVPETRELDVFAACSNGAARRCCAVLWSQSWMRRILCPSRLDPLVRQRRVRRLILLTGEGLRRLLACVDKHEPQLRDDFVAQLARVRKITRGPKPARRIARAGAESRTSPPAFRRQPA